MGKEYRDRIYIRKDILLNLHEHGEMNQTRLLSVCGLNNVRHKEILNDMVQKDFLEKQEVAWGQKIILKYSISQKGREVLESVLGPYEKLFPREKTNDP